MKRNKMILLAGTFVTLFITRSNCQTAATQLAQIDPTTGLPGITEPGSYYLGFDITGDITLASNVILDLNGHVVTGSITIPSGSSNVAVMNGFVAKDVASNAAISVATGCDNIELSNITVRVPASTIAIVSGILIDSSTNIVIEEVVCLGPLVESSMTVGIDIQNSSKDVIVRNCLCSGLVDGLAASTTSKKIIVKECISIGNLRGMRALSSSTEVVFSECFALANNTSGFTVDVDSEAELLNCIADGNNGNGFTKFGTIGGMVALECLAAKNASNGFSTTDLQSNMITKCTAIRNGTTGFNNNTTGTTGNFVANYSDGNLSGNYLPTGTPFNQQSANDTGGTGAQFWRNALRATSGNNC